MGQPRRRSPRRCRTAPCAAARLALLAAAAVAEAPDCQLHDTLADFHWARVKPCEAAVLEAEYARFEKHAHVVATALTKHKFRLPHRDQFPLLLNRLGLNGTAVEIGVREGHWSRMFLQTWAGASYHGIDPLPLDADLESYRTTKNMPEVYKYGVETIAYLNANPRWTFHHELDAVFIDDFKDASLDFVYIDSVHDYAHVKETFERWWPKVRRGGIIAGHDYCVADIDKREMGVNAWPDPGIKDGLGDRVPLCGKYGCIEGEFCYPKDINRKGRPKFGFAGVAFAALEAVEREQSHLQLTGEGGVVGNPSWWAVKP